jgi:3-oxoacyl-[acyl-carrier-protein] synthase III
VRSVVAEEIGSGIGFGDGEGALLLVAEEPASVSVNDVRGIDFKSQGSYRARVESLGPGCNSAYAQVTLQPDWDILRSFGAGERYER